MSVVIATVVVVCAVAALVSGVGLIQLRSIKVALEVQKRELEDMDLAYAAGSKAFWVHVRALEAQTEIVDALFADLFPDRVLRWFKAAT